MSLTEDQIRRLLIAVAHRRTGFILGAGASAPDVPVMRDLIQCVLKRFREDVHGFIPAQEVTPVHYLFAAAAPDESTRQQLLASSRQTFRAFIAEGLHPKNEALRSAPDQYKVLAMTRPGVPIINYNVDGLARVHCTSSKVMDVHGNVPEFVGRMRMTEVVLLTQEGIEIVPESSFWLPEPELEAQLLQALDPAYRCLLHISQLVIIGYSFGLGGNGITDEVSFNAVVEYCGCRDIAIFVVDPAPSALAECLGECLKNRTITMIPVYWNLLCAAVLQVIRDGGVSNLGRGAAFSSSIIREYRQLLD